MTMRGISMIPPLALAARAGTKTMTRRIARNTRHPDLGNVYTPGAYIVEKEPQHVLDRACPYGGPGDLLYVKEPFTTHAFMDHKATSELTTASIGYCADGPIQTGRVRPATEMPPRYARTWLRITKVRLERLSQITEEDAEAEGIDYLRHQGGAYGVLTPIQLFQVMWNGFKYPPGDHWVWVMDFTKVDKPCDSALS